MARAGGIITSACLASALCLALQHTTDALPLNEWPMIMTHDAGTGYLGEGIVEDWAKTQGFGFKEQLDCGARSFDLRPQLVGDNLWMHHGAVIVPKLVEEAVDEALQWTANHTDELVIVYLSHYAGAGSREATWDLMRRMGMHFITDCNELRGMTVEDAFRLGRWGERGSALIAIDGCTNENYVSSIQCYGNTDDADADGDVREYELTDDDWTRITQLVKLHQQANSNSNQVSDDQAKSLEKQLIEYYRAAYVCWQEDTRDVPFKQLEDYMRDYGRRPAPSDGRLWMNQAHWQYSAGSIITGALMGSSILKDVAWSQVNQRITEMLLAGDFPSLNFLEVDGVCDGGREMFAALQNRTRALRAEFKPF